MKTTVLILFISLSSAMFAASIDTVPCFYYVLENPKFFGEKARSWFEIAGLKNKKVQDKINKELKKNFYHRTGFYKMSGEYGWRQGNDTVTPSGYTDYTYPDEAHDENAFVQQGWVRFTDSDRYLRLTTAGNGYGAGTSLESFHFKIAMDKMAYICIHEWSGKNLGQYKVVELTFSLVDGRKMPNEFTLRINPEMKDSLSRRLDIEAQAAAVNQDGTPLRCTLIPSRPMSDSCIISSEAFIKWLIPNEFDASVFGKSYTTECDSSVKEFISISVGLGIDAMVPFLYVEEWNKLQEIYK